MNFVLQRFSDNRDTTLGILLLRMQSKLLFQGYTCEDEYREVKVSGETRIPAGLYSIVIQKQETPLTLKYRKRYPNWFENHLMIDKVPGFTGVYIHIGNTDSDTEGCILVGDVADNNVIGAGSISASTQCFIRLYNILYHHLKEGGKATIEIRDENKLI